MLRFINCLSVSACIVCACRYKKEVEAMYAHLKKTAAA